MSNHLIAVNIISNYYDIITHFSAAPYSVWSGSISQDVCVSVCVSVSVLFNLGGLVTQTILTA